jgi:hypothetical protein
VVSDVVDSDFLAGGVNVGVRSSNIASGVTDLGGGLSGVGVSVRRLSEFVLSVVLGFGEGGGNYGR